MMTEIMVNGAPHALDDADADMPLLWVDRKSVV